MKLKVRMKLVQESKWMQWDECRGSGMKINAVLVEMNAWIKIYNW